MTAVLTVSITATLSKKTLRDGKDTVYFRHSGFRLGFPNNNLILISRTNQGRNNKEPMTTLKVPW